MVGIAPHVSGPIVELPIHDNQHVAKGALLFVVDPRPYQAALDRAEAKLALTNLQIGALQDAIHSAQARQHQLEADDRLRQAVSRPHRAAARPPLRHRQRRLQCAQPPCGGRSRGRAARATRCASRKTNLGQYGDINARRKAAEAALTYAKLNVEYCYVRAPFDAYVTNLNIAVGQYANEGRQVLSLVDNRVWYVMANFRENFLDHIRPGCASRFTC